MESKATIIVGGAEATFVFFILTEETGRVFISLNGFICNVNVSETEM